MRAFLSVLVAFSAAGCDLLSESDTPRSLVGEYVFYKFESETFLTTSQTTAAIDLSKPGTGELRVIGGRGEVLRYRRLGFRSWAGTDTLNTIYFTTHAENSANTEGYASLEATLTSKSPPSFRFIGAGGYFDTVVSQTHTRSSHGLTLDATLANYLGNSIRIAGSLQSALIPLRSGISTLVEREEETRISPYLLTFTPDSLITSIGKDRLAAPYTYRDGYLTVTSSMLRLSRMKVTKTDTGMMWTDEGEVCSGESYQTEYCRNEASSRYEVPPAYLSGVRKVQHYYLRSW